jgi:hypothetical protein
MQVISVNNPTKKISWDLRKGAWPMKSKAACRSKIQYQIGQLILGKYPLDPILEDITIPDTRLSLDFYLPQRKIAFEIQGEQHSEMNPFFHDSIQDFEDQVRRDEIKELFCELNNIRLVKLHSIKEAEKYFGK